MVCFFFSHPSKSIVPTPFFQINEAQVNQQQKKVKQLGFYVSAEFSTLDYLPQNIVSNATMSHSLRRPSVEEQIDAPPAGAELKVRPMRKAAVHFSGRCEVIVSAFVVDVGTQRCQARVEPHSHSSNTFGVRLFFFKKKENKKENTVFDTSLLSVKSDGPTYLTIPAQQQQQ